MNGSWPIAVFILGIMAGATIPAAEMPEHAETEEATDATSLATTDLVEIDRKLNNPLTDLWSLTFQENYGLLRGDAADDTYTNLLLFQPALPIPVGENRDKIFIMRPGLPLVTAPVFDQFQPSVVDKHTTGFGDMQVFAMIGPNKSDGTVMGVGGTFIFPTASSDVLGEGKWQAGPAAMWFYMGKPWTLGVIAQHWWSFGGDSDRSHTNRTDLQYVIRRQIVGGWSLGMGPTITYDWTAPADDRLTLSIGLGLTKTFRWRNTLIKIRFEPQYSIIKPDSFGTEWNIRLQIAPVIKSPFIN